MQKRVRLLQNVAPQCKFRAGLALIPLPTDPDGVRTAPGGVRTASDGSGRLLVGPRVVLNPPTSC